MTLEELTAFFGWMAVINIIYLTFATAAMMWAQSWMVNIHRRIFGIDEMDLKLAYFTWVGNYKIMAMVFTLAPYIALKLI